MASDGDEDPLEADIYEWEWPSHGRIPTTEAGTIWSPVVVKDTFWRPNRWSAVVSETFRWLATKETVRWMSLKPLTKESSWLNLRLFRLRVKQHKSLGLRFWKLWLHSEHSLLWLGLCRARSLHWLGIWQVYPAQASDTPEAWDKWRSPAEAQSRRHPAQTLDYPRNLE